MDIITDIHSNRYTSERTPKWAKVKLFIFMSKVNIGTQKYTEHVFSVIGLNLPCHGPGHKLGQITNCDCRDLSQFVRVKNTTSQINAKCARGIPISTSSTCALSLDPPAVEFIWLNARCRSVSSNPAGSTIIYRFLCGFKCASLCQSISINQ